MAALDSLESDTSGSFVGVSGGGLGLGTPPSPPPPPPPPDFFFLPFLGPILLPPEDAYDVEARPVVSRSIDKRVSELVTNGILHFFVTK
jgi:hypothetical protein